MPKKPRASWSAVSWNSEKSSSASSNGQKRHGSGTGSATATTAVTGSETGSNSVDEETLSDASFGQSELNDRFRKLSGSEDESEGKMCGNSIDELLTRVLMMPCCHPAFGTPRNRCVVDTLLMLHQVQDKTCRIPVEPCDQPKLIPQGGPWPWPSVCAPLKRVCCPYPCGRRRWFPGVPKCIPPHSWANCHCQCGCGCNCNCSYNQRF